MTARMGDFYERRKALAYLTDEELYERFWGLAYEVARPLVDLAASHTTPSIERSVLLRMGLSSLEAQAVVERTMERGLLGKGAGNVLLKAAEQMQVEVREAGHRLAKGEGWDMVVTAFQYLSPTGHFDAEEAPHANGRVP